MPQFAFLEGQPFWVIYFTLLVVILLRAPATYWLGRGLGAGVARSRVGQRLGPKLDAAKQRIDRFGVSEPSIVKKGTSRIALELPGVSDGERVRRLLRGTARLEFRTMADPAALSRAAASIGASEASPWIQPVMLRASSRWPMRFARSRSCSARIASTSARGFSENCLSRRGTSASGRLNQYW